MKAPKPKKQPLCECDYCQCGRVAELVAALEAFVTVHAAEVDRHSVWLASQSGQCGLCDRVAKARAALDKARR